MIDENYIAKLTEAHNRICRHFRQYRGIKVQYIGCTNFTVKKIWNRGMGALELWDIDLTKRRILINTALFNKSDMDHLKELCEQFPELKEYNVFGVYYGYPIYYNTGFLASRLSEKYIPMTLKFTND